MEFSIVNFILYLALVLTIISLGFGLELLILWFTLFLIGYALVLVFFTWIPHYPHTITGRYHDTR